MLHFLCRCSYLFTFLLSSQFYRHIRLKSTAYFFHPPCIVHAERNDRELPWHCRGRPSSFDVDCINRLRCTTPPYAICYPCDAVLAPHSYGPVSVCLSVCLSQVGVLSKVETTDRAGFEHGGFLQPILHCIIRNSSYQLNKGTFFWHFS